MTAAETASYVAHHIKLVGRPDQLFTEDALNLIHTTARGYPRAVNNLSLKPGQEQFLAPVSYGIAATVADPHTTWQRVVLDGDEVVGFISANFDPDEEDERFRKWMTGSLLLSLMLGFLIPLIPLPVPELEDPVEIPERLTRLIMESRPLPPPPAQPVPPDPQQLSDTEAEPVPKKTREGPGAGPKEGPGKGILAFRESFAGVAENQTIAGESSRYVARPPRSTATQSASGPDRVTSAAATTQSADALASISPTPTVDPNPSLGDRFSLRFEDGILLLNRGSDTLLRFPLQAFQLGIVAFLEPTPPLGAGGDCDVVLA